MVAGAPGTLGSGPRRSLVGTTLPALVSSAASASAAAPGRPWAGRIARARPRNPRTRLWSLANHRRKKNKKNARKRIHRKMIHFVIEKTCKLCHCLYSAIKTQIYSSVLKKMIHF